MKSRLKRKLRRFFFQKVWFIINPNPSLVNSSSNLKRPAHKLRGTPYTGEPFASFHRQRELQCSCVAILDHEGTDSKDPISQSFHKMLPFGSKHCLPKRIYYVVWHHGKVQGCLCSPKVFRVKTFGTKIVLHFLDPVSRFCTVSASIVNHFYREGHGGCKTGLAVAQAREIVLKQTGLFPAAWGRLSVA